MKTFPGLWTGFLATSTWDGWRAQSAQVILPLTVATGNRSQYALARFQNGEN